MVKPVVRLPHALRATLARLFNEKSPQQVTSDVYGSMLSDSAFRQEYLAEAVSSGWSRARSIFTLSSGRVGTTQLAALLNLSPDLLALHEPAPKLFHLCPQVFVDQCRADRWEQVIHASRDEFVAFANHAGKSYVETNPGLTFFAPALNRCYPLSRFIHLHRHPYDVIRSGLSRQWYAGGPMDAHRIQPRPDDPYYAKWPEMSVVERIAWLWSRTNETCIDFMAGLTEDRRLTISAGAIFSADMKSLEALFAFCNASIPTPAEVRWNLSRRLNSTRVTKVVPFVSFGAPEIAQALPIVIEIAKRLGYRLESESYTSK